MGLSGFQGPQAGGVSPVSGATPRDPRHGRSALLGDVCCTRSADRGQFREENSPVGQPPVSAFCLLLVHLTAWTQSFPALVAIHRDSGCPLCPDHVD